MAPGCRCLNAPDDAIDVDAENPFKISGLDIGQCLHLRDAGIVDDDVKAAKRLLGVIDGSVNILALADIGDRRCRAGARRLDFPADDLKLVGLQIDEGEAGAVFRQSQGDTAPNALTGARHKGDFSFYRHAHAPFISPFASGLYPVAGDPLCESHHEGGEKFLRAFVDQFAAFVEQIRNAADIGFGLLKNRHVEEHQRLA